MVRLHECADGSRTIEDDYDQLSTILSAIHPQLLSHSPQATLRAKSADVCGQIRQQTSFALRVT